MSFKLKLANIKYIFSDINFFRRGSTTQRKIWLVSLVLGLIIGWSWFILRINNPNYYLKLADKGLVELKNGQKSPKVIGKIASNIRQAVFLDAKNPAVAETAAQMSEALSAYDPLAITSAMNYYDLEISLMSANPVPELRLAHIKANLKAYEIGTIENSTLSQALKHVDRAISLDPKYAEAYFEKALILEKLEEYDLAIEAARTSLVLASSDRVNFTLARLLFNRGFSRTGQKDQGVITKNTDLVQAKMILLSLADQGAEQLNALYLLVDMVSRLGDKKEMALYGDKLLGKLPNGQQKEQVRNMLK
ncbi:MAG: tetratricopeptide repeat protein [bacterium]